MGVLDFGTRGSDQYRECRRCGATVDDAEEGCPDCGSTAIAVYEF